MILIFGGAYQGKLRYALEEYNLDESDVYRCNVDNLYMPQNKKIIYEIDKWVLALITAGYKNEKLQEELAMFQKNISNEIIICNDISCGVVPVEANFRIWRETVGRLLVNLSEKSDRVVRLFCGIPTIIK